MKTKILTVPGFHGSDDNHWQTWLEQQFPESQRLTGVDWTSPQLYPWAEALEKQIDAMSEKVILVAHSFGCLVSSLLATWRPERVVGAVFVAPASPQRFSLDGAISAEQQATQTLAHFLPDRHLDLLGVLVASENDPWMSFEQAEQFSREWGLALFNAGKAGHINSESGYGKWPLLNDLVSAVLEAVEPLPGDDVYQLGRWNASRQHQPPKVYATIASLAQQNAHLRYN